jgi:hypothetical protein
VLVGEVGPPPEHCDVVKANLKIATLSRDRTFVVLKDLLLENCPSVTPSAFAILSIEAMERTLTVSLAR